MMVTSNLLSKGKLLSDLFKTNSLKNILRAGCAEIGTDSKNHYDVIIAGGGMVGSTMACTLGKNIEFQNKKILLLEGERPAPWSNHDNYSNRVSALNANTYKLLQHIGAWKHIEQIRYTPVKTMQVMDSTSDATIAFTDDDLSEIIAYIVENEVLVEAVNREIKEQKNVFVINESKIKSYKLPLFNNIFPEIVLENGTKYTCDILLGCDGINSQVRRAMGVQYVSWSYDQMTLVGLIHLDYKSQNTTIWQRFLHNGTVALLPLTDTMSSLVWSTIPNKAKELINYPEEKFVDALNNALNKSYPREGIVDLATRTISRLLEAQHFPSHYMRSQIPTVLGCEKGSRIGFPIAFGHATTYVSYGVALVGDAAHRVHPFSGQGVNFGIGDVACLNNTLGKAIISGTPLGNIEFLKQYETERLSHNLPAMLAIDGLHKLYHTDFTPLIILRSLGLQFANALTPLKKIIIGLAQQ